VRKVKHFDNMNTCYSHMIKVRTTLIKAKVLIKKYFTLFFVLFLSFFFFHLQQIKQQPANTYLPKIIRPFMKEKKKAQTT